MSASRNRLLAPGLLALSVATFVAYVGSGWLGLRLASVAGAVTLFWPPTGLSIAAFLLLRRGDEAG